MYTFPGLLLKTLKCSLSRRKFSHIFFLWFVDRPQSWICPHTNSKPCVVSISSLDDVRPDFPFRLWDVFFSEKSLITGWNFEICIFCPCLVGKDLGHDGQCTFCLTYLWYVNQKVQCPSCPNRLTNFSQISLMVTSASIATGKLSK